MLQVEKILFDEISKLPFDKMGKVLSYVRFVNQEQEVELILEDDEYTEFYNRLESSDFITSDELSAKIRALPDED